MTCLGVLKRGERGKDNVTGLKEGGGIKILTTVLHSRAAPSLKYSPASTLRKVTTTSRMICAMCFKMSVYLGSMAVPGFNKEMLGI